jgi:hypothetical protein
MSHQMMIDSLEDVAHFSYLLYPTFTFQHPSRQAQSKVLMKTRTRQVSHGSRERLPNVAILDFVLDRRGGVENRNSCPRHKSRVFVSITCLF